MTIGEMIEKIYDSTVNNKPTSIMVGSITGSGTINIKNLTDDYANKTESNFIIDVTKSPSVITSDATNASYKSKATGFTVSKSYNSSTGVLTISGLSQVISLVNASTNQNRQTVTQNLTASVYMF